MSLPPGSFIWAVAMLGAATVFGTAEKGVGLAIIAIAILLRQIFEEKSAVEFRRWFLVALVSGLAIALIPAGVAPAWTLWVWPVLGVVVFGVYRHEYFDEVDDEMRHALRADVA